MCILRNSHGLLANRHSNCMWTKCRFRFRAQSKLVCIHGSPVQWNSPEFKVDMQVQTCASTLNLRRVSPKLLSVNIQSIFVQVWGRTMINPLRQWRAKHQGGEMKPQTQRLRLWQHTCWLELSHTPWGNDRCVWSNGWMVIGRGKLEELAAKSALTL
jgi:hypothetical protein